ncbi:polysaccharide biosynthesis C-terminal domain-containing protein [Amnibacterium sp. CER49]|uniref:polysaccharide biosynthesis C-terminal domain-containing protein n=1 Tax=Amnibacterium sp. CER49 TaxID=3039161 RepID=UPI0024483B84|nr:polysaccharide biosynthesis C-terminal domain-containing protein [Amnibacterium sp. CER49]MDH2443061.1 polysaccharide biosynthesis C-terminal domain-containing protein [Amnibacterium sp. CER49]
MSRRPEGLVQAGGTTFGGIVVGAAATLLLAKVVGNGLGAAGTGLFFQAIALFAIVSNALQLGADTALVRTLSRQIALGERGGIRATVRSAVVPVAVVGALVTGMVLLAAEPLATLVAPQDPAYAVGVLRIMAPFLAAGALLAVLLGATRGLGSTVPYTLLQNIGLPVARLAVVALAMTAGLPVQVVAGAWAAPLVIVTAVAALLTVRAVRSASAVAATAPVDLPAVRRAFWGFALPRGASTLIERMLDWTGVLLVLAMAGPVAGGIYAVVNRCVSAGTMIDQAARIVVGPRISRALAVQDRTEASALFLDVTRAIVAVSWPFYLLLAVFAPAVLSIFGREFRAGALPLALVAIAMMLATTAGMVQSILLMGGRSSWQLGNRLVQLATLTVVTALLVPPLGLTGAAIGWMASIVVDTVLAAVQVGVKLGIRSSPRRIALPALLALVVFAGGGSLAAALLGQSVPVLVLAATALGLVYLGLLVALRSRLGFGALLPKRKTAAATGVAVAIAEPVAAR